jgi:hypothetical protein
MLQELSVDLGHSGQNPVAYTPLHGVGKQAVLKAFEAFGLPVPVLVPEQAEPDASFPTTPFPNPEEGRGVWELAHRTGIVDFQSLCRSGKDVVARLLKCLANSLFFGFMSFANSCLVTLSQCGAIGCTELDLSASYHYS